MLDALERSAKSYKQLATKEFISKSPNEEIDDNLIQKLFGGKLISSVTCLKCKKSSDKIDNYLDLSLHIYNSDSLERCFDNFCKPENLNGANKFFCENCKVKNDSVKKFSFGKCKFIFLISS
jgi:ubiquitin carboxyl-terminal hydrolase 36/42